MVDKKPNRKQATPIRHHPTPSGVSGWLMLVTGLVLGVFVAFLLHLVKLPTPQNTAPLPTTDTPSNADNTPTKTPVTHNDSPRFEFYKLLPENAPGMPHTTSTTNITPLPAISHTTTPPSDNVVEAVTTTESSDIIDGANITPTPIGAGDYLLQAGAFRSASDANKMQATIATLGLPVQIATITNTQGENVHRVQVGPFNTDSEMKTAKTILEANQINAVVSKSRK